METKSLRIFIMVLGIFYILVGISGYFSSNFPLILNIFSGAVLIIFGIFGRKSFYNKNFYMVILGVIFLQGAILICIYLFRLYYITEILFYVAVGSLIAFIAILIYAYLANKRCMK